jgi:hypothetical protein
MPVLGSSFGPSIPLLEIFIRDGVTFVALLVMMRVIGQREAGGLGITDILLVVLVAEAAAAGLHGDATSVTDGVLLVATILCGASPSTPSPTTGRGSGGSSRPTAPPDQGRENSILKCFSVNS